MNEILMVLIFGLVLAIIAQPTNNAAEEKGKYGTDRQCCFSWIYVQGVPHLHKNHKHGFHYHGFWFMNVLLTRVSCNKVF